MKSNRVNGYQARPFMVIFVFLLLCILLPFYEETDQARFYKPQQTIFFLFSFYQEKLIAAAAADDARAHNARQLQAYHLNDRYASGREQ